jgi:hypothetical protein
MKIKSFINYSCMGAVALFVLLSACSSPVRQNTEQMKDAINTKGTYGYDVAFFARHNIKIIELKDSGSNASVLLVPAYQGRVMTSSAAGSDSPSFGWINYKLIESGVVSKQFNPYGGEERLWLGPEGGPFSVYFEKGKEQIFANWVVPKEIDTISYKVVSQTLRSACFQKEFILTNYSGVSMQVGIERTVKLLTHEEIENALSLSLDTSLKCVAFQSENILVNNGQTAWNKQTRVLSLWMLAMFNPSTEGVVFIPYKKGNEKELGNIVNDDYFGKVPSERLIIKDGLVFFKTDGKLRSKIGISPLRALPWCGSYDPQKQVLTLLWCSLPEGPSEYVNSKWGKQDNPLKGDAINSYNDGPNDSGSVMGPFYEIESSSPAAILAPGGKITHKQQVFHISGDEAHLSLITEKLFSVSITAIKQVFK